MKYFASFVLLLLVFACKDNTTEKTAPTIYVAGWELANNHTTAKYWKDGLPVLLSNTSDQSALFGISLIGNEVYAGGTDFNAELVNTVTYWKDNVPVDAGIDALGMFASGNDLYFFGFNRQAVGIVYMKNGITTPVQSKLLTRPTGMTVSNGDVYIAGYADVPPYYVGYWKNGIEYAVPTAQSLSTGIAVSGTDVYVAGYILNTNSATGTYWKNGTAVTVENNTQINAIAIDGNDLYYAGSSGNNSALWKNGVKTILSDGTAFSSSASSLVILDGDVYVCGDDSNSSLKVWKNGVDTGYKDVAMGASASIFVR